MERENKRLYIFSFKNEKIVVLKVLLKKSKFSVVNNPVQT